MSKIPQSFIDNLMTRVDIVEIIDTRVPLKKAGKEYKACCPFHQEKTPSFTVSQHKQFYHCFGCGVNGNAISFVMSYNHLTFPEAIASLASAVGLEVPEDNDAPQTKKTENLYPLLTAASAYYELMLREHKARDLAVNYLKQRGISGKTAKKFSIGYAPAGWNNLSATLDFNSEKLIAAGLQIRKTDSNETYDRFRQRIMFPIRDRRGRVIGFGGRVIEKDDEPKYLNSPETEVFHKRRELYGLYEVLQAHRKLNRILVVEGYMDVVMLAQHGIDYAVATLGTATTPEHLQQLFRLCSEVVFCFDGDRAGYDAAWKALQVTLPILEDGWQINFMFLPQGEDPDSLVQSEGRANFEKRIADAPALAKFLFKHLTKELDMTRVEGQAKLVTLAKPLIEQIPGKILQHKLFDELATHAEVPLSALHNPKPETRALKSTKITGVQHQPSLMQQAITTLIQHPSFAAQVEDIPYWKNSDLAGSGLFAQLLELLQKNPQISTGSILEYWRDQEPYHYLSTLASRELLAPEAGLAKEFHDILHSLRKKSVEQRLNALQRKAKQGELNNEDRQQYLDLLTQKV